MTDIEMAILNATDEAYNYIIRSYDGDLYLMRKLDDDHLTPFFMYNHMFASLQPESGAFRFRKPILDFIEKSYLENVIRPFKYSVECVEKCPDFYDGFEFVSIVTMLFDEVLNTEKGIIPQRTIHLPPFRAGSMYKNMELNRKYTLHELELFA